MTETLFEFNRRNYRDCQRSYRGEKNQEYYLGDYTIEAGSVIDVRAEKKPIGSCSIIQLQSRTGLHFRRNWAHIREDATDVVVLWFVRRGQLLINHQNGQAIAAAGEFALTQSLSPFSMQCQLDADSAHEVLHVVVPAMEFRRLVPQSLKGVFTLRDNCRQIAIARQLFGEVFIDGDDLSQETELQLFDTALKLVADALQGREDCAAVRHSRADLRLQEVLRFIDLHLSDSSLSTTMVARACDMSPRYLSFLLKQHGTPFSKLVWDKRLSAAERWLATSSAESISIAEVAFRVGFKSPAHFSRMFKKVYGQGPREYRAHCSQQRKPASNVETTALYLPDAQDNAVKIH